MGFTTKKNELRAANLGFCSTNVEAKALNVT
jgi:hypothetical protein